MKNTIENTAAKFSGRRHLDLSCLLPDDLTLPEQPIPFKDFPSPCVGMGFAGAGWLAARNERDRNS